MVGDVGDGRFFVGEMARRMQTSRAAVDRLLDPANDAATLATLERVALAVGKRLQVALV